ncbi:MAG: hypothetical protein NVSMB19_15310 [Vulcanimicrobiaceae bacterium]
MSARPLLARPLAAAFVDLRMAQERALRAGDATTALTLGLALRSALDRRRTEQVAKRRLARRPKLQS